MDLLSTTVTLLHTAVEVEIKAGKCKDFLRIKHSRYTSVCQRFATAVFVKNVQKFFLKIPLPIVKDNIMQQLLFSGYDSNKSKGEKQQR